MELSASRLRYGFTTIGCHSSSAPLRDWEKPGTVPTPSHCDKRTKAQKVKSSLYNWECLNCLKGDSSKGCLIQERENFIYINSLHKNKHLKPA